MDDDDIIVIDDDEPVRKVDVTIIIEDDKDTTDNNDQAETSLPSISDALSYFAALSESVSSRLAAEEENPEKNILEEKSELISENEESFNEELIVTNKEDESSKLSFPDQLANFKNLASSITENKESNLELEETETVLELQDVDDGMEQEAGDEEEEEEEEPGLDINYDSDDEENLETVDKAQVVMINGQPFKFEDDVYPCNFCDEVFNRRDTRMYHTRAIHEGKTYHCDICEYSTHRRPNLSLHKRKNHDKVRYKCDICDFETRANNTLKIHKEKFHVQEKYKCEICDHNSIGYLSSVQHRKSFHEAAEIECTEKDCSYKGKSLRSLKIHKRKVHNQEETGAVKERQFCDQCPRNFSSQRNLEMHIAVKHQGFRFRCDACDFTAAQKITITKHKKAKHTSN